MEVDVDDDAKMTAISSELEGNPGLSPTPHDRRLSDSDLSTADE